MKTEVRNFDKCPPFDWVGVIKVQFLTMLFICNVDSELKLKSFELRNFIISQDLPVNSSKLSAVGKMCGLCVPVVVASGSACSFAFRRPDRIASLKEVFSS